MEAHFEVVNLDSGTSICRIVQENLHTFLERAEDIELTQRLSGGVLSSQASSPARTCTAESFSLTARDQNLGTLF
jgi:hypothetical protein